MCHLTSDAAVEDPFSVGVDTLVLDDHGTVVYSDQSTVRPLVCSADELLGDRIGAVSEANAGTVVRTLEDASVRGDGVSLTFHGADGDDITTTATVSATSDGDQSYYTLGFPDGVGESGSDRTIGRLGSACSRITEASGSETLARTAVDVVADQFGYEVGCLWTRSETGSLERSATTERARELVAEYPTFELETTRAGRAVRSGERVHHVDATNRVLTSAAHLPVGDYGVLTVGTTDDRPVSESDLRARDVLAATIEAVFDRLTVGYADRPSGQTSGRSLTEHLLPGLVDASDETEIYETACAVVADCEEYEGAAVLRLGPGGDRLHVADHDKIPPEHVSSIDGTSSSTLADGIVERACESADVQVTSAAEFFPGAGAAASETVGVVPLTHRDRTFGVLCVQAADAEGLTDLATVGDTVGFTLCALRNRDVVLSDSAIRLTFRVSDPDCLTVALSEELDTECEMKQTLRNADGDYVSYVRVADRPATAVAGVLDDIGSIVDHSIVHDGDDGCTVAVTRTTCGGEVMLDHGATVRRATATSGRGRLVLEAPRSADVRELVAAYQSYNPESELIEKRQLDRRPQTEDRMGASVRDRLTDRQWTALSAAYHAGYYDWPRDSTAEEVAASLDISAPTLHQHLRRAHQQLLGATLDV